MPHCSALRPRCPTAPSAAPTTRRTSRPCGSRRAPGSLRCRRGYRSVELPAHACDQRCDTRDDGGKLRCGEARRANDTLSAVDRRPTAASRPSSLGIHRRGGRGIGCGPAGHRSIRLRDVHRIDGGGPTCGRSMRGVTHWVFHGARRKERDDRSRRRRYRGSVGACLSGEFLQLGATVHLDGADLCRSIRCR